MQLKFGFDQFRLKFITSFFSFTFKEWIFTNLNKHNIGPKKDGWQKISWQHVGLDVEK